MQSAGLQERQVYQVRGFADQGPRIKDEPDNPANRRISLIVQYLDKAPAEEEASEKRQQPARARPREQNELQRNKTLPFSKS